MSIRHILADPDSTLPYQAQRSNVVSYDVDYRVTVTAPTRSGPGRRRKNSGSHRRTGD